MTSPADELIRGAIDMHCHHGPDPHRLRSVDAEEAAREADAIGMAALGLKSHAYPTGPVAILMQRSNGCAPADLLRLRGRRSQSRRREVAPATGAKVVWMPTFSSIPDRRACCPDWIALLDQKAAGLPAHEILRFTNSMTPWSPPATSTCRSLRSPMPAASP
jgi:hypothetical protein